MIVIADAGPLLHLFWVDALAWALPSQPILVVEAVWQEVNRHAPKALKEPRIQRIAFSSPAPAALQEQHLDSGEKAALTYALAQPIGADILILCDELRARRVCRDLLLPVQGSVGLILTAFEEGRASREVAEAALRDLPGRGRLHIKTELVSQALAIVEGIA